MNNLEAFEIQHEGAFFDSIQEIVNKLYYKRGVKEIIINIKVTKGTFLDLKNEYNEDCENDEIYLTSTKKNLMLTQIFPTISSQKIKRLF